MVKMCQISLLIGLILVGNGFCQLFEQPEISDEDDLVASPATLFGPKTFGLSQANLGSFGPLGYGGIGGMRIGSIGPLAFGHIGGIHADSFLGASNPFADQDESLGSSGILSGEKQNNELIGNPMDSNWQQLNDQENFIGLEPSEQEWDLGLQPQVPENSRAFLNDGLFGVKKGDKSDKFEKIPKPAPPPKFPFKHPPKFTPPPPSTYEYYGGYGSNNDEYDNDDYGSHGHGSSYGSSHGISHGISHGSSHGQTYRHYGGHGHGHGHYGGHGHGFGYYGGHGHGYGHGHYGGHRHGFGHHGGTKFYESEKIKIDSLFRANDEPETMLPYGYESIDQNQELYQIENTVPLTSCNVKTPVTTNIHQPNIYVHQIPYRRTHQSSYPRQSARSSVDDILDGLEDSGFDFDFTDLIEDVFLAPYLGLLDPNDLDDDTLLLL